MLAPEAIARLIEQIYDRQILEVKPLKQPANDWRGLYYVRDVLQEEWVLRIVNHSGDAARLHRTADLLEWLAKRSYPSPRVLRTPSKQLLGERSEWVTLLNNYIPGQLVTPGSPVHGAIADRVARLHTIPCAPHLPYSWWAAPEIFNETTVRLRRGVAYVPPQYTPLVRALIRSVERLARAVLPAGIIHGDCWYANAIQTEEGSVGLIDWDCAGIGPLLLDLGSLLLTAHFDLTQPLTLAINQGCIQTIMEHYQAQRRLTPPEGALMLEAIQFNLAFNAGRYLATADRVLPDGIGFQKLQARFDATAPIAELASQNYASSL